MGLLVADRGRAAGTPVSAGAAPAGLLVAGSGPVATVGGVLGRPLTPLTLTGSLVGAAVLVWALPKLLTVLFTLALAVLFALALDAPVSALTSRGMSRSLAVATVVVGSLGALVAAGLLIAPSVAAQVRELGAEGGGFVELLVARIDEVAHRAGVAEVDTAQLRQWVVEAPGRFSGVLAGVSVGVGNVLLAAVLAVWGTVKPEVLGARVLRFVPPQRRERLADLAAKVERRLRRWIVGQLTVMAAVGAGSYVVFKALGVPFAELFAVLAMLFEAIPAVGVFLGAAGPFLLLLIDDPSKLVWLVVGILVVQQLEDRLLIPRVMGRAVELPEAMVLAGAVVFGVLFGIGGLVLAVPVLAAAVTVHDELTAERELAAGAGAEEANHVAAVESTEDVGDDDGRGRG